MADKEDREKLQQDAEITSQESLIDEDGLELCLGLRPIHCRRTLPSFHNLPQPFHPQNAAFSPDSLPKRDAQALRRFHAKKKRDLKRKANHHPQQVQDNEVYGEFCKAARLNPSFWTWWSCNSGAAYFGGAGGGFRPYLGPNGIIPTAVQNAEGREGENRQSISGGTSSGISDHYQSTSGQGGNNSSADAGSHSSYSQPQCPAPNAQTASPLPMQPCSSLQADLQPSSSTPNSSQPQLCSSSSNKTEQLTSSRQPASKSPESLISTNSDLHKNKSLVEAVASSNEVHTLTTPTSCPKEAQGEMSKPPKPNEQMSQQKLVLSQMPCVSATGNGPNGKTITGFLYRYTKAEVSIVCVCHGTSFSPAGFVEHAGGVDVEHPLRHIRVIPFAFG